MYAVEADRLMEQPAKSEGLVGIFADGTVNKPALIRLYANHK